LKYTKEKLYELLPAIYRQRDIEEGKALEDLLSVIAEPVEVLEEDIEKLYNNWFIETCDPWIIPYIGDLMRAKVLHPGRSEAINTRAFVANTIRYRRRKGTLLMLEQLARDVTGWNARAVEFFKLLSTTQHLNHLRLSNFRTPDLREKETLELLDTPFDTIAHTVDVRDIRRGRGFHNIPNIGIFLWRLQAYPVIDAPAFKRDDKGKGKFTFNQLGYDMPLFNHPEAETSPEHIAEEINVPARIRRLALHKRLDDYYAGKGKRKSIRIKVDGSVRSSSDIVACDLSDWGVRSKKVAIDPFLGRIVFPKKQDPTNVHVSYYYGFSSEVGGGFYQRPSSYFMSKNVYEISKNSSETPIIDAVDQWHRDGSNDAILEIVDSEVYEFKDLDLNLPLGSTLEIRSKQRQRPVLRGSITITAEPGSDEKLSHLILDGLLIDGSIDVNEEGDLGGLTLRHCTLVPKSNKSLLIQGNDGCLVTLERTISGGIEAGQSNAKIRVKDSIVDGRGKLTIKCYELTAEESTIFGGAKVEKINLVSNTIFTGVVTAKRRQVGCVRFSYIPLGSKVPRRYRCQPEHLPDFIEGANGYFKQGIRPHFTSEKYGDPGYAQLGRHTPPEIFEGADDGAEMGVFNHLQQVHRIKNLKSCLDEYLRFGLKAGVIFVS